MYSKLMITLTVVLAMVALLASCDSANYSFIYSLEEIDAIEIVQIIGWDTDKHEFSENLLAEINDQDAFLKKFKKVDCSHHYTDPMGIVPPATAIKIIYKSGAYELITDAGVAIYTPDAGLKNWKGYYCFNKKQFDDLLAQYIE